MTRKDSKHRHDLRQDKTLKVWDMKSWQVALTLESFDLVDGVALHSVK